MSFLANVEGAASAHVVVIWFRLDLDIQILSLSQSGTEICKIGSSPIPTLVQPGLTELLR
jgi:hypothetical protein